MCPGLEGSSFWVFHQSLGWLQKDRGSPAPWSPQLLYPSSEVCWDPETQCGHQALFPLKGMGRGSEGSCMERTGSLWVARGAEEVLVRRKWWDLCLTTMAPPSSSRHHCLMVSMEEVFGENKAMNLNRALRQFLGNHWLLFSKLSFYVTNWTVRDVASPHCSLKMGGCLWSLAFSPAFILHPAFSDIPQAQRGGIPSLASQRVIDTDTLRSLCTMRISWLQVTSRFKAGTLQVQMRLGRIHNFEDVPEVISDQKRYLVIVCVPLSCIHGVGIQYCKYGTLVKSGELRIMLSAGVQTEPPPSTHMLGYKKIPKT